MPVNILLIGGAGALNLGDEALLLSAVQCIRRFLPTAHLTVSTPVEEVARWTLAGHSFDTVPAASRCLFKATFLDRHYARGDDVFAERWERCQEMFLSGSSEAVLKRLVGGKAPSFIDRKGAARLYSALLDADAVILYGGGILTSPTKSRLWNISLTAQICGRLGTPLFLRSHQIGPILDVHDEEKLKDILDSAAMVSVRDRGMSKAVCHSISPAQAVWELADDALFVELEGDGHSQSVLSRQGVGARSYISVRYRAHHSLAQSPKFIDDFAAACRFAQATYGMPLLFVPLARGDEKTLNQLRRISGCGQVAK